MSRPNLAVVARRNEPPDSLDYFPTPPWATRSFASAMRDRGYLIPSCTVGDPACGEGHMAAVLQEFVDSEVWASDIFPYGFGEVGDFLDDGYKPPVDWWVMNPPFNKSVEFVEAALTHPAAKAAIGVAALVRLSWLETEGRVKFFRRFPPHLVLIHADRVPMHKGVWKPRGSTATAYCWVIWLQPDRPLWARKPDLQLGTRLDWIGPGARQQFALPDDARRFGAVVPVPLLDGANA